MKNIKNLINNRVLILDGATGTELQKRGMPRGACPEKWCLENPAAIQSVHKDYVAAGSNIVCSCTFGANRIKLGEYGIKNVKEVNRQLVRLAKKSVGKKTLIAGDIGPTGKFVEPFGPLKFEEAVEIYKEQVNGLLEGGADLFIIETMMDIQEARAALIAVKEVTKKFVISTMTFEKDGRTLNGTDPVSALITLQSLGADAVGCNCSTGPEQMLKFIKAMRPYAKVPLVAKANAGMPRLVNGQTLFEMGAKEFSSFGKKFISSGVAFIGGCCGTTPDHIRELHGKVRSSKALPPFKKSISALSSARSHLLLDDMKSLKIVGECINPTGKKDFQEELRKEKTSTIRQLAKQQEKAGADCLDVNVGASGVDEVKMVKKAIHLLSVSCDLPLVIDSSNVSAVKESLRIYPGRALINSISAEKTKIKELLPVAAKYGAMFILLPLNDKGVPHKCSGRKKNVIEIFEKAKKLGYTKDDIVVDALAMTIASDSCAANETIKMISWCSKVFKSHSVIGLSNISFGMPHRSQINAAFLAMAKAHGLSLAIANPFHEEIIRVKKSKNALSKYAKDPVAFLSYVSKISKVKKKVRREKRLSDADKIYNAVLEGNREDIKIILKKALDNKVSPKVIVHDVMIPAINNVGELFDKKEYFLPQLIASAETMKIAFAYLEPLLKKTQGKSPKKTVVILATVKGDIHDIGKNIVSLMLKNHGFDVVDLGKDVSSARIIREVKKHKATVVGLSALMTTTMVNMGEVIGLAKKEGLDCRFIVGGAVVTESYALSIGAEYAKDSVKAVKIAKNLTHQ